MIQRSARRSWRPNFLYLAVFCAPIVAGVIRKLLPGQPVAVEAAPFLLAVSLTVLGGVPLRAPKPGISAFAISAWVLLAAAYSIPAFYVSGALGAQALALGAGVPLLGLIALGARTEADYRALQFAAKIFVLLIAGQVVLGIIMLTMGNSALPDVFRANGLEILNNKENRIGQPILAGFFTTAPVNSIASLCALGVCCTLVLRAQSSRELLMWLFVAFVILTVIWMTGRRGALFLGAFVCFSTFLVGGHALRGRMVKAFVAVALPSAIIVMAFSDQVRDLLFGERMVLLREGQLNIADRLNDVFLVFVNDWAHRAPFGNYTGYASGVGKAFGVRDLIEAPAEVGAAMIIAEQGLIGLFLFTFVFVLLQSQMLRSIRSAGAYWSAPLVALHASLFGIFFFKENSALFPGFIGSLFYWSLPGMVALCCFVHKGQPARPVGLPHVANLRHPRYPRSTR
jgi:hypothetical protein